MQQVFKIDVDEWDDIIKDTYGKPYSFQQQDGCKERGTYEFEVPLKYPAEDYTNKVIPEKVNGSVMGVSFETWLARDPLQKLASGEDKSWEIEMFWERNFYPDVEQLIQDLYQKGKLPEGCYLINIDW